MIFDFVPITGYDFKYWVNSEGEIYSDKRHKYLKHVWDGRYFVVTLSKKKVRKKVYIHILIAAYFIPNPNRRNYVIHIDGDKENNHISNLEWTTQSENIKHAWRTGLRKKK